MLAVYPEGYGSRSDNVGVNIEPPPDYAAVAAAAGGAFARTVHRPSDLDEGLSQALHAVRTEGRSAVLDVWIPHL